MAYPHPRDPRINTKPKAPQRIDLVDLKDILGKAIKHPRLRKKLLADPEAALKDMNYVPHKAAVDFFKALDAKSFEAAAKSFSPHHSDSSLGMAEC